MDLQSSRRGFLKLFGATLAAVAVAPVAPVLESIAPQIVPARALPPNVLHVIVDGDWKAMLGLSGIEYDRGEHSVDFYQIGSRLPLRLKGVCFPALSFSGPLETADLQLCKDMFYSHEKQRFALSFSGAAYEFDGAMMSLMNTLHEPEPEGAPRWRGDDGPRGDDDGPRGKTNGNLAIYGEVQISELAA